MGVLHLLNSSRHACHMDRHNKNAALHAQLYLASSIVCSSLTESAVREYSYSNFNSNSDTSHCVTYHIDPRVSSNSSFILACEAPRRNLHLEIQLTYEGQNTIALLSRYLLPNEEISYRAQIPSPSLVIMTTMAEIASVSASAPASQMNPDKSPTAYIFVETETILKSLRRKPIQAGTKTDLNQCIS